MPYFNDNGNIIREDTSIQAALIKKRRSGDGLIETMLVHNGSIPLWPWHLRRLHRSMKCWQWDSRLLPGHFLMQHIHDTIRANKGNGSLKLRIEVFKTKEHASPQFLIECSPLAHPPFSWPEKGLHIGIARKVVKDPGVHASIKSTARLPYLEAAEEAVTLFWDEVLLKNTAGHIVEGTITNIFCLKGDKLKTPALTEGCVAGVFREVILTKGNTLGISIEEGQLSPEYLAGADEVFLCNAVRGIQPVSQLADRQYPHILTQRYRNRLMQHLGL